MAPKVNRRPAGAPRPPRVLRQPAAPAVGEVDRGEEALREDDLAIGSLVHGEDAAYYNTPCQFSGRVMETTRDVSGRYLVWKLMGTSLEGLLTWGTGTSHPARVHLCPAERIGAKSPVRSPSTSSPSSTSDYTPVDQKRMFGRSGLDPVKRA